jgi:hypothetical protein
MKMKAKTIQHAIEARILAVVLLATCAVAAAANAQTVSAKFTLPYEVHWSRSVLPAGNYTIRMNSSADVILFRSADGKTQGFTPIPAKASSDKGPAALLVMIYGRERVVRSLNLPSRGISLVYSPATSAEREMLAKADHIEVVPVITARK